MENKIWDFINLYLRQDDKNVNDKNKTLINHHISSYEKFIDKEIDNIIKLNNPFIVKKEDKNDPNINVIYKYTFSPINLTRGTYINKLGETEFLTIEKCKLKGENYIGNVLVDVTQSITFEDKETGKQIINKQEIKYRNKNFLLCQIPIMVGSKYCLTRHTNIIKNELCAFDNGGYFIINGNEKVIICQERMCDNKIFIFKNLKNKKISHTCDIRSNTSISKFAQLTQLEFNSIDGVSGKCTISFKIPKLIKSIPLFAIFKYLSRFTLSDKDMLKIIIGDKINDPIYFNILEPSLKEWLDLEINDINQLTEYINDNLKNKYTIENIVIREILPHIENLNDKLYYLGYMTKEFIDTILGRKNLSDRDNFANKRLETTGILLSQLFYKSYYSFLNLLRRFSYKDVKNSNILKDFKKSNITRVINFSMSTGNWNMSSKKNKKVGVSQELKRMTYSSTLSNLRRINAPIGKQSRVIKPRKLHNSQYGYCCAVESPEGEAIGLLKNLSLSTLITNGSNPDIIKEIILKYGIKELAHLEPDDMSDKYSKILINGTFIGVLNENIIDLINYLKELRRKLIISIYSSIYFDRNMNVLYINTDPGRLTRPLFIVKDNKLPDFSKYKTWKDILFSGEVVEYIDSLEMENCMVAVDTNKLNENSDTKYTHCEIHPCLIFGVCGSVIPLPEHNQSPRE